MAGYVPDIQEQLRAAYEEFAEEQTTGIQFVGVGEPVTVRTEPRWRFERSDHGAGYVLQNSSLVYHTTAYTDFDDFIQQVIEGFLIVARCANISKLQRIGLRYVDLIEGQEGVPVEALLHPKLQGFGHELQGVSENISNYVFSGKTSVGQLVFRATGGRHEIPLPPDLLPLSLKLTRTANPQKSSFFLDTDHFMGKKRPAHS